MAKVVQLRGARPGGWAKDRWRWIGAVMAAPGLNATAKLIAVALAQGFANHETAECRPGLPALMAAINAPKRTVMQALADLKAAGWIAAQGGNAPGKVAAYVFRWPGQVQDNAPEQVQTDAPEQVQDFARTGAGSCAPPKPPYMDQPNMNQNTRGNRWPRSATKVVVAGGARPTPFQQIILPDGPEAKAWDEWLAARGLPLLAVIGRKAGPGMLAGWDMPWRYPPSERDEAAVGTALRFVEWLRAKA